MPLVMKNSNNDPERVKMSYDILKTTSSLAEFKPCLKKYLNSQIRSKIIQIQPKEWEVALFLPTAIFKGATTEKVYGESLSKIRTG